MADDAAERARVDAAGRSLALLRQEAARLREAATTAESENDAVELLALAAEAETAVNLLEYAGEKPITQAETVAPKPPATVIDEARERGLSPPRAGSTPSSASRRRP
jgi:hypothetical protein